MKKRKWCYVVPPYMFDIACDKCEGSNIAWSEFEHCIWCFDCKIDTRGTGGIFDGPIPLHAVYLLGLTFDKVNLETNQIEKLNLDKLKKTGEMTWDPPDVWKEIPHTEKDKTILKLKDKELPFTYGEQLWEEGSKFFKLVPTKHNSTICQEKDQSVQKDTSQKLK